jgi:hypothetical protein
MRGGQNPQPWTIFVDNDLLNTLINQANKLSLEVALKRCATDPYYFLTEFCLTMDEHWQHKGLEGPYNLIPKKEYIHDICDVFQTEDLIAIEKTRQMMASWIFCGLALHDTMFKEGRRTFLISKKEKDANALIDRCKGIYDRLPEVFKNKYPRDPEKYLEMKWGKRNSIMQGVPEGSDQVRSYTASLIVVDEASFQNKVEKVIEAAQPSLAGGGKLVLISTPNGREYFWRTVYDQD